VVKFNYKILEYSQGSYHGLDVFERTLNDLGRYGWELVSVTQNSPGEYVAIFKWAEE